MGKKYIKKVIDHIENNLFIAINIQSLSESFYVSAMQLYRDFYSYTGHSVKEYVRKRRLSCALAMVKHSDMPLIDIAINTGYSSQQNFTKYVKSVTSMSPLEYKKGNFEYYFPPMDVESSHQVTVMTKKIPKLIGMEYYSSCIKDLEHDATEYLLSIIPQFDGRLFGRNGKSVNGMFCYELFITYDDSSMKALEGSKLRGFKIYEPYSHMFAMTTSQNVDDEINAAWDYLYVDWLKTSMFEQSNIPYFEEYVVRNNCIKKLILYLHIQKKEDYNSISIKSCDKKRFLVSAKSGVGAEKLSAKEVLDYVKREHPMLLRTGNEYYIEKQGDVYTSGIRVEDNVSLPEDNTLQIIEIPQGEYALLKGDCTGDIGVYGNILQSFLIGHKIKPARETFAIYNTDMGFEDKNINMTLYCKIK